MTAGRPTAAELMTGKARPGNSGGSAGITPTAAKSTRAKTAPAAPAATADEPKARVTLNLDAAMYRDIERWATDAAGTLGVPRVSVQKAIRAMIHAAIYDLGTGPVVIELLRRDQP